MTARGWRWRDGGREDRGGVGDALLISQGAALYLLSAAVAMTTTRAAAVTALLPFSPFPPSLSHLPLLLSFSLVFFPHSQLLTRHSSLNYSLLLFICSFAFATSSSLSLGPPLPLLPDSLSHVPKTRDARMAVVFHLFFFLLVSACH